MGSSCSCSGGSKQTGSATKPDIETGTSASGQDEVLIITTGETFGADNDLLNQVKNGLNPRCKQRDCIIVFCPVISRIGSDVEAALSQISDDKRIILVLMHHNRDADYSTAGTKWSETHPNVDLDVHVLYHETQGGLLPNCSKNNEAVRKIQNFLNQKNNLDSQCKSLWIKASAK